jgi:predicted transcriptional regulator YheO
MVQPTEVVLHDLRRIPNTVRAIAGNVTGRRVGDPPTDKLLERLVGGNAGHKIGYHSALPDGRQLRCSTIMFHDTAGQPAAALCINTDISAWLQARSILDGLVLGGNPLAGSPQNASAACEYFPTDVEELSAYLIRNAIEAVDIPVELMRKEHKMKVVAELDQRGFFLVKESSERVASELNVTRFTIYNYLNALNDEAVAGQAG